MFGKGNGIINANGHNWENNRRFTLRKLRDIGVFKSSVELFIMEEAHTLLRFFERNAGKPLSGKQVFNGPVVNSLWRIVSGESNSSEILKRSEDIVRHVLSI